MKIKKLSIDEIKKLQLEMLEEIDSFCRNNNIKYALSCGTLIGAIRHKGYIPWDDDVDITMSYSDVLKFRELFVSENLKYCDIVTEPNYEYHFSRIVSKKTYSRIGLHKSYGVCIDLYPIIECTKDNDVLKNLVEKGNTLLKKRLRFIKWYHLILKYTPFSFLPGYKQSIRNYYNYMIKEIQLVGGGNYYQMGGPLKGENNNFFHNLWSFNPLEVLIDVDFENHIFLAPANYKEFLETRYGEFMKQPPINERHAYHGGSYYWK